MIRVDYAHLLETLYLALHRAGLSEEAAQRCAAIHADSTRDGIQSHGIGRIPRFIDYVARGWVDITAEPSVVQRLGAIEVLDGQRGIGVLNAMHATERAMTLARESGVGIVAMRNTTHWMRGGSYGWKAAEQGFAAMMWTNTESCMPAWGATSQGIGNNPLVMAVPREKGPLVLDMAMSQFSYGRLKSARLKGEQLPVDGGFDANGELSRDPGAIEATRRLLPTGYWKGSGLAILLDALAAMLSQGRPSFEIDQVKQGSGTGCCQVFILFDPAQLGGKAACGAMSDGIAEHLAATTPIDERQTVRYPGESTLARRRASHERGVEVDSALWDEVCELAGVS
ncbi:3-dehydro-L-gulonate 2-dehydrogenase [Vreelandella olivaria]|uniref:3-dehydro-L-gulonate 2-dehydrogenase n=1 Tax=Vreelandella olivaria TaxID=390919 RepID=UPI00201EBFEA|nr:3-dehydro-L-gulonate 2-dehydrogenase [Halomonas olivaria]